jgi:hypothetical protein
MRANGQNLQPHYYTGDRSQDRQSEPYHPSRTGACLKSSHLQQTFDRKLTLPKHFSGMALLDFEAQGGTAREGNKKPARLPACRFFVFFTILNVKN